MKTETRVGQGGCYCKPENRRKGRKPRTATNYCECGFKVRGKNHADGNHHNHKVAKCRRGSY